MILLVGLHTDALIRHLTQYLRQSRNAYLLLDQQHIGSAIHLTEHFIRFGQKKFPLDAFSGIYNRMVIVPAEHEKCIARYAQHQLLLYLLHTAHNVINPPLSGIANHSKPYQLHEHTLHHMQIPESVVLANSLSPLSPCPTIYKSVSAFESTSTRLFSNQRKNPIHMPTLFQKRIFGTSIRVHVFGKKIFPIAMHTQALDYRQPGIKSVQYKIAKLPKCIKEECYTLTQKNNLIISGIDLIKTQHNQYTFLEVNPSPGYTIFERKIGYTDMTKALVHLLSN